MPLYPLLPIIGVIACIIFMLGLPRESLALGIAIILALLVLYYSIVEIRYRDVPRIKLFD
jgi:ABC-type transport system involved in cytochrome bd biosynthesis fused ATPase/permease subunit